MKHTFLLGGLLALGMLTACDNDIVDGLDGHFAPPSEVALGQVADAGVEECDGYNLFHVEMRGEDGSILSTAFVGNKYYLAPGDYAPGAEETPVVGSYRLGQTTMTLADGSHAVSKGIITVGRDGDNYTFAGVLWLDNGTVAKFKTQGTLHYERKAIVLDAYSPYMYECKKLGKNLYQINLCFTSTGVRHVMGADGNTKFEGTGSAIVMTFISYQNRLCPGTYAATDGPLIVADANPQPLSWLRGGSYKMSLFGFEFDMPTYGQYYNVVDGVNNPVPDIFVTEGTVEVANPHDNYFEITLDNTGLQTATQTPGEVYAKFAGEIAFGPVEGAIPGQEGEEAGEEQSKTYTYSVSTNPEKPLERTIAITDNEGNAAAQFVFLTLADSFEGTYDVVAAPEKAGDMSIGMELFGMMLGSYFNADGKNYSLQAGTKVQIAAAADGTLSFHLTNLTASDSSGNLYGQSSYSLDQVKKQ